VLIDGFTIVAQIVNFLVLVLLLKRFLYKPVMRVMQEREERIAQAVAQSEIAEKEARQRAATMAAQQQAFLEDKAKLMADAKMDVDRWREEKIESLRTEINDLRLAWLDQVDQDRQAFLMKLKGDAVRHVMRMGDKIIRDLADQQMESRIIAVFMKKMEADKKDFHSVTYTGPIRFLSGFELSAETKENIRETFIQWFPSCRPVAFEVSQSLGMGLEVVARDKKVAWNLEKYLKDLEREILLVLPSKTRNAA